MATQRICPRSRSHDRTTRKTTIDMGGIARSHGAKSLILCEAAVRTRENGLNGTRSGREVVTGLSNH